jgi:hypothetical protein
MQPPKPHFPSESPELDAELAALPRATPVHRAGPVSAEDLISFQRAFSHPVCLTCGTPQYGREAQKLVRRGIARPPLLPAPDEDADEGDFQEPDI